MTEDQWALCESGWVKTVLMVASTICWTALGTKEGALRMKCTRHLCHKASCRTLSMAYLKP